MALIDAVTVPEGERGNWRIERFTIDHDTPGRLMYVLKGRSLPPGNYTRLIHKHRGVVMSDTPSERHDHYCFVQHAKGHVLINGLGLGMALAAILREDRNGPAVEKITVIEVDEDVIALVGPHYLKDPRVEIIHASAYDYKPPKGVRYGAVWHDIWDTICGDNVEDMKILHRKYGKRADWQGSWARLECERAKRQSDMWERNHRSLRFA